MTPNPDFDGTFPEGAGVESITFDNASGDVVAIRMDGATVAFLVANDFEIASGPHGPSFVTGKGG